MHLCIVCRQIEKKLKAGTLEDMDMVVKQTAQDFEDACAEELKKYKPASRITGNIFIFLRVIFLFV